ncbi:3-deoxy-D-manno-octulosonic-acid transferase [Catenovulum agarivorans DS-2]|uniref:3-deoxy-D-manno-octulosonic acid transferase n=1 Tax=Catenovulum agarivorans DS-2 TaxID=1328313 RepID=W7QE61_9ALTE|nr:lipid IV(A) 3-deoxy-D-manno-octulosonic acid transferase [Catenovulum agarivorans]EWH11184.1 3-deoxy-D-manno-octulosonic-acid transferase [Catenovulum agarivorans DS-2]
MGDLSMLHFIYNQLMRVLLPLMLIRLKSKSRKQPEYGIRWDERLGKKQILVPAGGILFHVASLGEAISATPIIQQIMQHNPTTPITVTSTTPTGSEQIKKVFAEQVTHCYLPFDLPIIQRRFINQIQPNVLVLMETELWPNLIFHAKRIGCKVMVINARMSKKSASGYKKLAKLTQQMMQRIDLVAAQFDSDAARFIQLGCKAEHVKVVGNVKFDTRLTDQMLHQINEFKQTWNQARPVWLAASTHKNEEELVLSAHKKLLSHHANLLLILLPRHPDRFDQVFELSSEQFITELKTDSQGKISEQTQVLVGDTLGEMAVYISLADIVFMGGSLVNSGGHNPFEAACQQKAILSGPHTFNFEKSYQVLEDHQACTRVNNAVELSTRIDELLNQRNKMSSMSINALECQHKYQGATAQTVKLINNQLEIAIKTTKRGQVFTNHKANAYN